MREAAEMETLVNWVIVLMHICPDTWLVLKASRLSRRKEVMREAAEMETLANWVIATWQTSMC